MGEYSIFRRLYTIIHQQALDTNQHSLFKNQYGYSVLTGNERIKIILLIENLYILDIIKRVLILNKENWQVIENI